MNTKLISALAAASLASFTFGCADLSDTITGADAAEAPAAGAQSVTGAPPVHFIGTDGDWFDPQNWDSGSVPGADDDVLIDGDSHVVVDPAGNPSPTGGVSPVVVHDILLRDDARFETLPGTSLFFNDLDVADLSTFFAYSSDWHGGTFLQSDASGGDCPRHLCGYNPSVVDVESYEVDGADLTFYLGGIKPATPGATGQGHYANVRSGSISLTSSELAVGFKYGFVPSAGDQFVLMEASGRLVGSFDNYADGDEVAQAGGVKLVISYEPRRIVLKAEPL